jgi:hypothetical protein
MKTITPQAIRVIAVRMGFKMHLRVWWKQDEFVKSGFFSDETKEIELNGIIVIGEHNYCLIRDDDGEFYTVNPIHFIKSEWTSNPDDGESK